MTYVLPNPTDTLASGNHSKMHRVFVIDTASPEQSITVDSSGNIWMLIANTYISHPLVSNTAYGTAPFVVSSNTVVTNLNADFLDGLNGSYFLDGANFTGTIKPSVLSNSNTYIGTTSISLNRASANLAISGISISGISATFSDVTQSTSNTTGSVVISGGLGIAKNVTIGGNIAASGSIRANSNTATSNTSTGSLIVTGGAGISGSLNVGGIISSAGSILTSNVIITANSASSNTSTGSLVIVGGMGISGDIYTAGQIYESSDIRLKSDIEVIPNALEKVLALNGYTFDKNGRKSTGLIAQEVIQIIPEAVSTDDKYLAVSYGNLVGLLIEAIKEQNEKISSLENLINNK